jgi:hypothetical protein
MDPASISAPLGALLHLDRIQFFQYFDRNNEIVVVEFEDAVRIMD